MSNIEIICLSQTCDTILLKASIPLLKQQPKLIEYNIRNLKNDNTERIFTQLPALKIDGEAKLFGIRAVLRYLFHDTPHLKDPSLTQSLFSLSNHLYISGSVLASKVLSLSVKEETLSKYQAQFNSLLGQASKFLTIDPNNIGTIVLQQTLNIFSSIGVSISPCTATELPPDTSIFALSDELLQYAISPVGIPIRYEMSPPPEKPMYLSTPIYYVNGVPHIGHVFTTTLVETIASWFKIRGINCIYSTGTDEHGLKVQTTAAEHGISPIEWCNQTSNTFFSAFKEFDLQPDVFIRTTEPRHIEVAIKLWRILYQKGYIYLGKYEGWYSKREEAFIPDNQVQEVVEDGITKHINSEDGAELMWSSEPNWMFKLSAMQEPLLKWLDSHPTVITPRCYFNQIRSMVTAGLNDISISRQKVSWGIPVPDDPNGQTMYVWIDALANYLTVAGWTGLEKDKQGIWPCDLHTVGKDIVKFHAIYWPAFLIAAGIPVYTRLLVHGWWTVDMTKMSKSLGNALDPIALKNHWGLEAVKYYLLRECTLDSDSDYSDLAMKCRYNNDLAHTLGNLVMRIISPNLNPKMELEAPGELQAIDKELISTVESLPGTIDHCLRFGQTKIALMEIWDALRDMNKYFTVTEPWKKECEERNKTVIYVLAETMRLIAVVLKPFMRQTANAILKGLGAENENDPEKIFKYGLLKPGTKLSQVPILFKDIN